MEYFLRNTEWTLWENSHGITLYPLSVGEKKMQKKTSESKGSKYRDLFLHVSLLYVKHKDLSVC